MRNLTCKELVKEAAKIIYMVHDEVKDKMFDLELSWISAETKGRHERVPDNVHQEAEAHAKASLDDDSDSDADM